MQRERRPGSLAVQTSGLIDLVGVNGKMNQRALLEREDRILGIAVKLILIERAGLDFLDDRDKARRDGVRFVTSILSLPFMVHIWN